MKEHKRLYFLDALRAFAILMMLQGHFISGILDPNFKNPEKSKPLEKHGTGWYWIPMIDNRMLH